MLKRDIRVGLKTNADVVRLRDLLLKANEVIYNKSCIKDGVIRSEIDCAVLDQRHGWMLTPSVANTTIEELEQILLPTQVIEPSAPTMTVTREAISIIYGLVCHKWRQIIMNSVSTDLFSQTLIVPEHLVKQAWDEACSTLQKEWLEKYLPKPKAPAPDYTEGTPCLVTNSLSCYWHLAYADGKNKFYLDGKRKSSYTTGWTHHRKLNLDDLPQ